MPAKKLTLRDIAKMTGVSYTSVSRALSGAPGISDKTREKVLEVCRETGYTTNFAARTLAANESKLLGLITGSIDNPFMGSLGARVEHEARTHGYDVILCNSDNLPSQEAEMFRLLLGRMVDGVIIAPANSQSYKSLAQYLNQIPTVFVGENLKEERISYVTVDNYEGTCRGTSHLISLGHRKIAYIGRRKNSVTHQLRSEGYATVMKERNLSTLFFDNERPSSTIEQGYALGRSFLADRQGCTAVVAATDTIALGVMQAIDEAGLRIPENVSLMGFDDIFYSRLPRINLTTVRQPTDIMSKVAVNMLLEKIRTPSIGYTHQVLEPQLILRSTCAPIPADENAKKRE